MTDPDRPQRPTDAEIIRALSDCFAVIGDLLTRHGKTLVGHAHRDIHCGALPVRDRLAGMQTIAAPYDTPNWMTTHSAVCWAWGPRHYECAVAEIERLQALTQPKQED